MFCRNCGKQIDNLAVVCIHCGVKAGAGFAFCQNCGTQTGPGATICTTCGVALTSPLEPSMQKSKLAAGLFGIFLGAFGVHNFYLGFTGKAVGQLLLTVLSCGMLSFASAIWGLIEGILILTGSTNVDAKNIPLKE